MSDKDELNVESAYALTSTDDCKELYASWAESYDETFVTAQDFIFPRHVAETFHKRGGRGPVLDAGAGTGLLAQEIQARGSVDIDAFDLSAEMLAVARKKNLYRDFYVGDLTATLPLDSGAYASVVSSGTFTHGHVGPEALDELLRVAASDALFVLSIKTELFENMGFHAKFRAFGDAIHDFEVSERNIYGSGADASHAEDTGLVVSFFKS